MWSGFNWLRIGYTGWILCKHQSVFEFNKSLGIFLTSLEPFKLDSLPERQLF